MTTLSPASNVETREFLLRQTAAQGRPASSVANRPKPPRRYIYCLTDCNSPTSFGPRGIEDNAEVFTVAHEGLAAVVSATSSEKLDVSRANALAHQHVLEAVMQRGHTVLPVKFNTLAEDKGSKSAEQRIIDHVLIGRNREIVGLLSTMRPLVEIGVKALWTDMDAVFAHIAETDAEIKSLRKKLVPAEGRHGSGRRAADRASRIKLGELVKQALETRKSDLEADLLGGLAPLAKESRKNKTFGDPMFANLALLMDSSRQDDLDAALSAFETRQTEEVKLRCVGPLPPSNFVELVITWDD